MKESRTVLTLATHYVNEGIVSEYKKMKNTPDVDAIMMINNFEFKYEYTDRLCEVVFFGVSVMCFFFDENLHDEFGLPYYPYDRENYGKVVWYNPEYRLMYLRKFLPEYKYYWMFDSDVFCNSTDGTYSGFLHRFDNNEDDLIINHLRREQKNTNWVWSHKLEWVYENTKTYGSLFSVERLSGKAIDLLYKKRLEHKKIYDSYVGEKRWVLCEAFVPTELIKAGLSCSDLDELYVNAGPNIYLNDTRCFLEPNDRLYHPVKYFGKDLLIENKSLTNRVRELERKLNVNINLPYWLPKARIDIKNYGEDNDVKVRVIKGENCNVYKALWFSHVGAGYTLETEDKHLVLIFECIGSGELLIQLRGLDRRVPSGERLPLLVDYTRLVVNDKVEFWETKPQWHDNAYYFKKNVADGEKVQVEIFWSDHCYKDGELAKLLSMWVELLKGI